MHGMDSRMRRRMPDNFKPLPVLRDLGGLVFDWEGDAGPRAQGWLARRLRSRRRRRRRRR